MRNHAEEPRRIQRKRVAGWRIPPNTAYVGRPTKWGNPWPVTPASERSHGVGEDFYYRRAVEAFSFWIEDEEQAALRSDIRLKLKGKDLACWCKESMPCHADVLLQIANDKQGEK